MTIAVIVILGAAIVGTLANIFLSPLLERRDKRYAISPFLTQTHTANNYGPAATLLALLIAFVLASAYQSFAAANTAVQSEATVLDNFFETADYVKEPFRERFQRSAVCYARAVAGPEWTAMGSGGSSPAPGVWTGNGENGVHRLLVELGPSDKVFSKLYASDQKRGESRRTRLAQAKPSIPGLLMAFMIGVLATMLIFLAVTSPRLSPFHITATVISSLTLVFAISLIRTLDRPYSGPIQISQSPLRTIEREGFNEFVARYGAARLGCDAQGKPTGAQS